MELYNEEILDLLSPSGEAKGKKSNLKVSNMVIFLFCIFMSCHVSCVNNQFISLSLHTLHLFKQILILIQIVLQ